MITNDEELNIVREQAKRMELAIESLAKTVRPKNQRNFEIFAEGYVDQLSALRYDMDVYLGIAQPSDIEIAVEDPDAGLGTTRISAVTKLADHFRKALRTTVEAVRNTLPAPDRENVTNDFLNRLCDPPLRSVVPGSVRVQLDSPHVEVGHDLYAKGLELLSLAIRAASNDVAASAELEAKSLDLQKAAWNAARSLAPEKGDLVETIGFSGRFVGVHRHVQFTSKTRKRVNKRLSDISVKSTTETVGGMLDEIDYGKRLFTLREADTGSTVARCKYAKALDAEVDVLRKRQVEVSGTRRSNALRTTPLRVRTIRGIEQ
jgi:hypothetical protein